MINKKGQITLFIIIAIIIVASGVIGYFIYKQQIQKKTLFLELEIADIKDYLQEMINYEVSGALILVGLQGGYTEPPAKYLPLRYHFVPYYYDKRKYIPTNEKINEEIKKEIIKRINKIKLNFTKLKINNSNPKVNVNHLIEVSLPVTIKKGDVSMKFTIKQTRTNPFNKMLNVSKEIVKNIKTNPKSINLELLINLQQKYDVIISPLVYDESTIIYRIADNQTIIEKRPLEFYFAVKK
ncbi:hypothetical protein B6U82_01760 [Candidatus Pacearchaeota archaeon ex4484_31]|nr:MAG: hypothetical protein B6U82_01760 [Candidatus Pacearchaeota archaeon ex4484_31]